MQGGQNVNKVNTKAQLRFHVKSADWIPTEAKERFSVQQAHRMNNDGEFIITSQEQRWESASYRCTGMWYSCNHVLYCWLIHRSQTRNKADCLKKLKSFLDQALIEPKTREQWQEIGEKGKATRKKDKIHTKNKKSNRRGGDFYWLAHTTPDVYNFYVALLAHEKYKYCFNAIVQDPLKQYLIIKIISINY